MLNAGLSDTNANYPTQPGSLASVKQPCTEERTSFLLLYNRIVSLKKIVAVYYVSSIFVLVDSGCTEVEVRPVTANLLLHLKLSLGLLTFNPLKHSGVRWLHFKVFSAIQV